MQKHLHDETRLVNAMLAERVYDPVKEPHLLVFEYFGKLRLRKEQYTALMEMIGSEENIELEARTGFGKSKVLIPLWLFLKSKKDKAAMITLPASLLFAQHMHLKKILCKAYDAAILPLEFNRSKANDIKYLKKLLSKLKDAKENNKIVLTTIQALHGMVNLKLKESLTLGTGATERTMQKRLLELRELISKEIANFIDESKVCFNIRHRYDYAVGAPSSVDPEKISDACTLYRKLLSPPYHRFEFLPSGSGKTIPLQENYETEMLPLFARKVMEDFAVPSEYQEAVLLDLQGHYSEGCEAFYTTLSPDKLRIYAGLKKQLTVHLRRTLFRKCDDGYGFSSGSRLAIPFLDGTAKKSSEFSEVEDYIDFTIQANLKKPFSKKEIQAFVEPLKIKSQEVGLAELSSSKEFQLLLKLTKTPLMKLEDADYEAIAHLVNQKIDLKLDFIEAAVLPQIKIYKKKITSTPFNLIRAVHHIQAASGTVNPDMLPPKFKTLENNTAVIGNLTALWKDSPKRIFALSGDRAEIQLENLLKDHSEESVLIDAAGSSRDLDMRQTAEAILNSRSRLNGVVLFDDEGREFVYEKENKAFVTRDDTLLEIGELFAFIRKSKAVGTDLEMPSTAQAIVTVERDSSFGFIIQAVGRMRKLVEGQKVGFALSPDDAKIIFGDNPHEFRYLLDFLLRNQEKEDKEDAFYVL
ncbi:MAG: DEAD/DEAH box helicase family protein [Chlamydiales bacterium]|nr:DEAD/DEAH box helicase family protein [Chlamydiales bacterium]